MVLATMLALGFGFWAVRDYSISNNLTHLVLGLGSFVASGGMVGYLFWFLTKMKRVGMS